MEDDEKDVERGKERGGKDASGGQSILLFTTDRASGTAEQRDDL